MNTSQTTLASFLAFVCARAGTTIVVLSILNAQVFSQSPHIAFDEVSSEMGLVFLHHSPFTPERHLHLTMGSGLGWLDFDVDGRPDLYCAQGTRWTGSRFQIEPNAPSDKLFRNLGDRFQTTPGIEQREYAMGVGVGDANNDGFADIYISNFGMNHLLLNHGDGTFSEGPPVLQDTKYGASSIWGDIDLDGDLDLYVCNYVAIDDDNYPLCEQQGRDRKLHIGCPPRKFVGSFDCLFLNQGDGTFAEGATQWGMRNANKYPGLGAGLSDWDGDGRPDIFVANDATPNQMWLNQEQSLQEQALLMGTALNRFGSREAGMGVAIGDVNNDLQLDLFVTHYYDESNTLYQNLGGLFLDVTKEFGLAAPSRLRLAFGTVLIDFNGDTWPDCLIANGHLHDRLQALGRDIPYEQSDQIFVNRSGKRFEDASASAGDYFQEAYVGRGLAAADFDNDGRPDVAIQNLNDQLKLLRNRSEFQTESITIHLIGTQSSRDPVGTKLFAHYGSTQVVRQWGGATGYLSSHDKRIILPRKFEQTSLEKIELHWPTGVIQTIRALDGNPVFVIEQASSGRNE